MSKLTIVRKSIIGGLDAEHIGSYAGVDYYVCEHADGVEYLHGFVRDNHVFRIECNTDGCIKFNFEIED